MLLVLFGVNQMMAINQVDYQTIMVMVYMKARLKLLLAQAYSTPIPMAIAGVTRKILKVSHVLILPIITTEV